MKGLKIMLLAAGVSACVFASARGKDNSLSKKEAAKGWKLLFDGRTPQGWQSIRGGGFPASGWTIENGAMTIADNNDRSSVGDVVTDRKYGNFELTVDFRFTEGANSGIKYFVNEGADGKISSVACEFQILDDARHPDAKLGRDGNRKLGSLYDVIPAGLEKTIEAGTWNTARIVVDGPRVEHWLNGKKILTYERGSDAWREGVDNSKFKNAEGWGLAAEGYILLQDHGKEVSFKNIKIREL